MASLLFIVLVPQCTDFRVILCVVPSPFDYLSVKSRHTQYIAITDYSLYSLFVGYYLRIMQSVLSVADPGHDPVPCI